MGKNKNKNRKENRERDFSDQEGAKGSDWPKFQVSKRFF